MEPFDGITVPALATRRAETTIEATAHYHASDGWLR